MNGYMHRCQLVVVALASMVSVVLLPSPAGALPVSEDDPGSPAELSNLGLAYQLFDAVFNGRDADLARTLVTDDAVIHTAYGDYVGPDGLMAYISTLHRVYTGAVFDVSSISVSGDTVTVDWSMTATWRQTDPVEPPIDVNISVDGSAGFTMSDARIADLALDQSVATILPADIASAGAWSDECLTACIP